MVYKLVFVRRSRSSFKIYVCFKHKVCFRAFSGQSTSLFRFGSLSKADVFVRNFASSPRIVSKYFRDLRFFNDCFEGFIKFVDDARTKKKSLPIFG